MANRNKVSGQLGKDGRDGAETWARWWPDCVEWLSVHVSTETPRTDGCLNHALGKKLLTWYIENS